MERKYEINFVDEGRGTRYGINFTIRGRGYIENVEVTRNPHQCASRTRKIPCKDVEASKLVDKLNKE